jgi:hypothetical protein
LGLHYGQILPGQALAQHRPRGGDTVLHLLEISSLCLEASSKVILKSGGAVVECVPNGVWYSLTKSSTQMSRLRHHGSLAVIWLFCVGIHILCTWNIKPSAIFHL